MSFAEWEFFLAAPSQQAYVDITAPLVGTGSLRLVGSAAGTGGIQAAGSRRPSMASARGGSRPSCNR